jgi:glyoxalase family protein
MTHHKGIHHITLMAGDPKENVRFYTQVLGMRMVKKSVNQDDPGTYHLFYGNQAATPGSSITFFPWPRASQAKAGTGEVTTIYFQVPEDAKSFWKVRFEEMNVDFSEETVFGRSSLKFFDPDKVELQLVFEGDAKQKVENVDYPVDYKKAIQGFWGAKMLLTEEDSTAELLTSLFEFEKKADEGNVSLYQTNAPIGHSIILDTNPTRVPTKTGRGTVHHIAFRAANQSELDKMCRRVSQFGLYPTQIIDRHWFKSVYYRIPQGVLFEMASDDPGYAVDEDFEELGEHLILPPWLEDKRGQIESVLPELE